MRSVDEVIREHLEKARQQIQTNIESKGKSASGKTIRSLTVEVNDGRGSLSGFQSLLSMERGRRPGKIPKGFVEIITEWVISKGISVTPIQYIRAGNHKYTPQERGLYTMAGAIAYNIAKKGDRQFRSGRKDDIYSTVIQNVEKDLGEDLLGEFGLEVEQINKTNDNG